MYNGWNLISSCLLIVFLLFLILGLMYCIDRYMWLLKVKNYLLQCSDLEKAILKTFVKNCTIACPLTNNHDITIKLSNLSIVIKVPTKDIYIKDLPKQSDYYLNPQIYKLILKESSLKNIYLSV